jgi:hypothetical protein
VGACDDDDLVDGGLGQPSEHLREEKLLLGAAEPRRLARSEDDRGDRAHQLSPTVTLEITTGFGRRPSPPGIPSASIRSTVSMPSVTFPTIA